LGVFNHVNVIYPGMAYTHAQLANVYYYQALYRYNNGLDYKEIINMAVDNIESALRLDDSKSYFFNSKASILVLKQISNNIPSQQAMTDMDEAFISIQKSLDINDKNLFTYTVLSKYYLNRSKITREFQDKKKLLLLGIKATELALKIKPNYAIAQFNQAELLAYGISLKLFTDKKLSKMQNLYKKAQAFNPLLKPKSLSLHDE
jgi:tetratricopeptide (TPR) repeat protein